ncbi:hypothetical protein NI35_0616 [Salmonella enterica subsp. enterica serovar Cerro]|uniref:Uncharacterized protein n=2 Tax=Salmonella enterica I TaxID=59201 RepID=A0A0N1QZI6_SALSV|nr:conserved hypothetical protein [Salmonella enterica subsp. enterica serovar Heidelberg str. SL476]ACF92134.1 conserved hypothetical protein [Salmonella enterica subsp. enterica serovar Schwarzengrund str. CVM19633]AJQ74662.1 hypothetical protein AW67_27530 [Salmonella enterica subsp. enterica serovar Montevideo str. USDA-ARS-USMARC-1903]APT78106.1 hypothetical protein GW13_PRO1230 [Salmonella enterica subsp. enterica serovar Cerro]EDY29960.1 conserved hypothetical protein [Salmonella enteric
MIYTLAEYKLWLPAYSSSRRVDKSAVRVKTERFYVATSNAPPTNSPWHSAGLVSRC